MAETAERPLRLGISSCLLGNAVRWDGGHRRDRFVTERLARHVEFVPVCPELEAGMGVPRPTLRLVGEAEAARIVEVESGRDHTRAMERLALRRVRALGKLGLSGFILKKDSPSCGMERVKVYREKGGPLRAGSGIFAAALRRAHPDLPIEDEGRLNDAGLRENFIERVFAHARLAALFRGRLTQRRLVAFHTAHKIQLMSHSTKAYRELGRLVAEAKPLPRAALERRYRAGFMQALAERATPGRNANALQHAAGHLKNLLDPESRSELAQLIDDYRRGLVPLVVPITLLRHHAQRQQVAYLLGQTYLDPHPKELMLRNHV